MTSPVPQRSPPLPPAQQPAVDLRALWQVLVRRRWAALAALLIVVVAGIVITIRTPKIYRATAMVLIETRTPNVLNDVREVYDPGNSYWSTQDYYETQYQIIRSRRVVQKAVAALGIGAPALAEEIRTAAAPQTLEGQVAGDATMGLPEPLVQKIRLLELDDAETREEI